MDLFSWALVGSTSIYLIVGILILIGLFRSSTQIPCSEEPFVTVVIAARNEASYIRTCVNGLINQTYPANRYEVLVVDDESDDQTRSIVEEVSRSNPLVRCLSVGDSFQHMVAKKRPLSVGIREARGEIILTTDGDCRVPPTWISGMVGCFHPEVGAVIGFSQVKSPDEQLSAFERLQGFDFLTLMTAAAGTASMGLPLAATGQNLAYRRSLFNQVGGFEKIGHRPSGDDVLLLQLFSRVKNYRIEFSSTPGTFVSTWRTESPKQFYQQRKRWASNALYQLKLNRGFFLYISAVFSISLLAPLGAIFGTPAGSRLLPLGCLSLKAMLDLIVSLKGASRFNRPDLLKAFPVWEILQYPYTVLMGVAGSLGRIKWKKRVHV